MINVAILGFGVVGSGCADLLVNNKEEIRALCGEEINIKHILDLRDFPNSPFSDKVTHSFDDILNDKEVSCVIEVMGGSHPSYEYTVASLKAGKSVITSNKEVVANFGDEFLRLAKECGVVYRFEASVGGGIPVISPLLSCVKQNKIKEIRGILNGTTNYILTQMFTYGASFESALSDAQAKGYAERNPDADILGTDACRKIAILSAIATGELVPTAQIHTEGITAIRAQDIKAAEHLGYSIKLVGRTIKGESGTYVMVAPFMIKDGEPLSTVSGVYNAVEVVAEPLGNVMFYGQGAGAGATASAVIGDLMQVVASGAKYSAPVFKKTDKCADFSEFSARNYIALENVSEATVKSVFGNAELLSHDGELAVITDFIKEREMEEKLSALGVAPKNRIRIL